MTSVRSPIEKHLIVDNEYNKSHTRVNSDFPSTTAVSRANNKKADEDSDFEREDSADRVVAVTKDNNKQRRLNKLRDITNIISS